MSTTSDEIDLGYLINKFNKAIKSAVIMLFKAISFIIRNWIVVLILLIAGLVWGYFSQQNYKPSKKATLLVRTNFGSGSYAYNAINFLKEKSKSKDSLFLITNKFRPDTLEINDLEITPIVNLVDLTDSFRENDRNLDIVLRNVEFDGEEPISSSFTTQYKYHNLELTLSSVATSSTVEHIITYLNNNQFIQEVWNTQTKNLEYKILQNERTIAQIDTIITNFNNNQSTPSSSSQLLVVDNNLGLHSLLNTKVALQDENNLNREELIRAKKPIVLVNNPVLTKNKAGVFGNKMVKYPFVLIGLFLLLAWFKHIYFYLQRIAKEEE